MIQKILNINSKSFNNYSSNDEFKKVNIIFGINGSGKTSLAKWLEEKELDKSRVFNSEYVSKNILTQDSLMGVKLTVGQAAVDIEKIVTNIKKANINLLNHQKQIERARDRKEKNLLTILNTNLEQAKKHFELTKSIKQKPHAEDDPIKAFHLWIKDIQSNSSMPNSSKELEQQKILYQGNISDLKLQELIGKERFNKFAKAMKKVIPTSSDNITNEIIKWITSGLEVHNMNNENEVCQFCGNSFNGPKIAKIIKEKTNNEHAQYISALKKIDNDFNQVKSNIVTIKNKFNDFNIDLAIKFIDTIKNKIATKIKDTSISVSVDNDDFNDLSNFYSKVKEENANYQKKLDIVNNQLSKIERVARSWIGEQLKENAEIPKIIESIQKYKQKDADYTFVINSNNEWKSNQESAKSDLKAFKDLVNNQFELLGLNFRLEIMPDDKHYLVKSTISGKKLNTKDLSEGECRLLGFLQFYFALFDKPHESLAQGVELIIIDDPITSLDTNNRYYLTELVNNLAKEILSFPGQLFIFTHSSLDFHNFGFNANKQKTEWFTISKDIQGHSSISIADADKKKNYSDYYQANFNDVFRFALLSRSKLPTDNYISYGNKARLLFESHARTHYKLEYVTNREHDKLKEFYQIPEEADECLTDMLDVINSLSHGMTFSDENPISPLELQRNIRFMFKVLYNKDKFHVEQMVGNLINKGNHHDVDQWLSDYDLKD